MTSYEIVVTSQHDVDTDTAGHRFPDREEAGLALASLREWFGEVVAEVVECDDAPTISYEEWMERGL